MPLKNVSNNRRLACTRGALFFAALLAPSALALARAGGGEGFGGGGGGGAGGGGGGGGHGGGGGLGYLIYLLIRLVIVYPAIGVPAVILVIVFFVLSQRTGTSAYQSSVLRRGGSIIAENRKLEIIQQLRAHDPAFDESAFCKRVESAFMQIQAAWCAQNLSSVQIFLSDGVAERFSLQFAEQRDEGYRDRMQHIRIDGVRIVDLNSSGVFDEISVRIAAWAADERVTLADGRRISGSSSVEPFVEIWSFLRRRGAVTDISKPGLIEGHCPNCGAAVTINESAQCPYCKALLHSGQFDWVLSEITQESEWERTADHAIAGLDTLRQKDEGFSPQALEDRASVIFWRKASADRLRKIDPLRKVAVDAFCQHYATSLTPARRYAGDPAVGGVHMMRFIEAGPPETMDRILVQIRWSATLMALDNSGKRQAGGHLLQTSLLVLGRQPGIRTEADKSISSAHCPNCGAPESQSIENACANCGTVLNDGSRNWVLLQWLSLADPAAQSLLRPLSEGVNSPSITPMRVPSHMTGLLAWAVKMSVADGRLDPRERSLLEQFAAHGSVAPAELDRMITAAGRGDLQIPEPADPAEAREWLMAIARFALSDGTLDRRELQLLNLLGSKANLSDMDIGLLVKRVQAQQYAAARSQVRF